MSVYEVHLGSWRRGLDYRELADQLVGYVQRPRLHPRRAPAGDGAPVRRLLGLPGDLLLRADLAVRRPRRLPATCRPAAPGRHRRDRRLGAGALPQGRLGAGPLRRHPALRAPGPAPRRAAGLGHATSSTSAAARCATSWSPTRSTGSRSSTSTALRVDAVASMLYLDYSREPGQWVPNEYGGRENLDAVAFLQEINATVLPAGARRVTDRRGVDRLAGRHPAHAPRRARASASSGTWAGCTTRWATSANEPIHRQYHHHQMTFSMMYAYSENFVLPISPRRGRARQGLAAAQDARRPLAAAGQPARLPRLHVGAPRQAAAVHGHASSARSRSGPSRASWTGGCSTTPTTAACSSWSRDLNRVYRETAGAVAARPRPGGLPAGSTPTTPAQQRLLVPALRRRRRRRTWPAWRTSPRCRTTATGSGCRRPARWEEVLNTDAEALRRLRRRQPRRRRGGRGRVARPARVADVTVPPLASVWFRRRV